MLQLKGQFSLQAVYLVLQILGEVYGLGKLDLQVVLLLSEEQKNSRDKVE